MKSCRRRKSQHIGGSGYRVVRDIRDRSPLSECCLVTVFA